MDYKAPSTDSGLNGGRQHTHTHTYTHTHKHGAQAPAPLTSATFIIAPNTPSFTRPGSYMERTSPTKPLYAPRAASGGIALLKSGFGFFRRACSVN